MCSKLPAYVPTANMQQIFERFVYNINFLQNNNASEKQSDFKLSDFCVNQFLALKYSMKQNIEYNMKE